MFLVSHRAGRSSRSKTILELFWIVVDEVVLVAEYIVLSRVWWYGCSAALTGPCRIQNLRLPYYQNWWGLIERPISC
ncbi:hypothetical protein F0562_011067 [Nyssa sinensis]|uniref:Uncharacterized protein n=1 Tax=Nyssa sinensis TaxID=561372 RepID=A0A5J5A359_9ASTE|nr:hypothetical protein F0562_011067 [Nyssa sinensis]